MHKLSHTTLLLALFLLTGLLNQQFLCGKNLDCRGSVYSFAIGVSAYPDRDSIGVGDTIWLEVNEPTTLKDVATGRDIDYSGAANLGSAIAFQRLSDSGVFTINAVSSFQFALSDGTEIRSIDAKLYKEYLFKEADNRYMFRLGVVPKDTGTYRLIFSNAANVYRKSDKCTKADFRLNFKNTNQHYQLNPFYPGGPVPVGGDYYFKVVR